MQSASFDLIDHERLIKLIASAPGEEPVVSLFFATGALPQERRLALKNLTKEGEDAARRDTEFDEERRKTAVALVRRASELAEGTMVRAGAPRGTFVAFASNETKIDTFRLPVILKDRIVVDRTPYTSPLSAVLDQYERYGIVIADHRRGRVLEVYLGAIVEWEKVDESTADVRKAARGGGHDGLEDARRRNHQEYELHRHLDHVAARAFAHFKAHGFDKLIVAGPLETLPRLVDRLHPYLRMRIVSRETWALDLATKDILSRVLEVERRVEAEKEKSLLSRVRDHVCGDLLATTGFEETLRALYFGKVGTLVVEDGAPPLRGRECPECRCLLVRREDEKETTATLVECPQCQRPMRPVVDIVDEAVEFAIQSGAKVEHIAHAKGELAGLGGMASLLRFR